MQYIALVERRVLLARRITTSPEAEILVYQASKKANDEDATLVSHLTKITEKKLTRKICYKKGNMMNEVLITEDFF